MHHQTVIVVGASSGMGLAVSRLLWRQGATVWMVARDQQRLEAAAGTIGNERLSVLSADIGTDEGRRRIADASDRVDHLVVTAADLVYKPSRELDEEDVMRAVRSKVVGPYLLAPLVAEKMTDEGSIIFVSGIAAERPMAGGSVTGLVNGAINAMVHGLALELAPIRVNAVSPGWVHTPFWTRIGSDEKRDALFSSMRDKLPVRRITTVDDVAMVIQSAVVNRAISGTTLYVDGGQRLV